MAPKTPISGMVMAMVVAMTGIVPRTHELTIKWLLRSGVCQSITMVR